MKLLHKTYMAFSIKNIVLVVLYLLSGMFFVIIVCDQVYGEDEPSFVTKWGYTGSGDGQFNSPWLRTCGMSNNSGE